jgi:hypothetical protein
LTAGQSHRSRSHIRAVRLWLRLSVVQPGTAFVAAAGAVNRHRHRRLGVSVCALHCCGRSGSCHHHCHRKHSYFQCLWSHDTPSPFFSSVQTLNVTTFNTPPMFTFFTLMVRVVSTVVSTPNPSSYCYPGDVCPVTIAPSKGAASNEFFIELLGANNNILVLALTDRTDPQMSSLSNGDAVFSWTVPVTMALGQYNVRVTTPSFGLDASTGVSLPFTLAKPYTFVVGDYGRCSMSPGTGSCGTGFRIRSLYCTDIRYHNPPWSQSLSVSTLAGNGTLITVCAVCLQLGWCHSSHLFVCCLLLLLVIAGTLQHVHSWLVAALVAAANRCLCLHFCYSSSAYVCTGGHQPVRTVRASSGTSRVVPRAV